MKRISFIILALVMIAVVLLAGCASAEKSVAGGDYYSEAEYPQEAPGYEGDYGKGTEETVTDSNTSGGAGDTINYDTSILQPGVNRKIVYYGQVSAQTKNFEEDSDAILTKLEELGGYVQNVSSSGTKPENWQQEGRYAQMTLRVPNEKFSEFMQYLGSLGETQSTSMRGDDISLQYFNTTQQLETLRAREERLQELLKQAATMEDIIELEKALSDVSDQIKSLETDLRTYDSLIDFSTVDIYLKEVMEITEVAPPAEKTLGERISSGFYSVLTFLAKVGEGLIVFFVSGIPVWIILAVILVPTILLIKRARKKRRQNAALHPQNPPGMYPGNPPYNPQGGYMGNPPYNQPGGNTGNPQGGNQNEK